MNFYHASPKPLSKKELICGQFLYTSNNKEFVEKEFLEINNYKYLYKIELYKTKQKTFSLLKTKCFKIFLEKSIDIYGQNYNKYLNFCIADGEIIWTEDEFIKGICQEFGFNMAIFNENGLELVNDDWCNYIKNKYSEPVYSLAILDPKIIKKIIPIYID